jgi:hypothetical protein
MTQTHRMTLITRKLQRKNGRIKLVHHPAKKMNQTKQLASLIHRILEHLQDLWEDSAANQPM